jgi:hypothetical protein
MKGGGGQEEGVGGGLAVTPKTLKYAFYLRLEASVIKIPFCAMHCTSDLWG